MANDQPTPQLPARLNRAIAAVPSGLRWRAFVLRQCWVRGRLDRCAWIIALCAARLGIPMNLVFEVAAHLIAAAGDTVPVAKTWSQVERAYAYVRDAAITGQCPSGLTEGLHQGIGPCNRRIPPFNPAKLAAVVHEHRQVVGVDPEAFIKARSPVPPDSLTPSQVLDQLYCEGERVIVFTDQESQGQALWTAGGVTVPGIPTWGPAGVLFLVQPVTGEFVPNPRRGGWLSRRSEEAVTAWRYAVLESDEANPRDWMTMLAALPMPIAAIYSSGGKSIHALVRVDASSKRAWDQMIAPLKLEWSELGADSAALTAVRLSRLPQAWRGNRQQRLLYLDPAADSTPIMALPISTPTNT